MSEPVKRFTREEWESPQDSIDGYIDLAIGTVDVRLGGVGGMRDQSRERHLLAALLLNGQPFGFTREDVTLLQYVKQFLREGVEGDEKGSWLLNLADRIEALLPPDDHSLSEVAHRR